MCNALAAAVSARKHRAAHERSRRYGDISTLIDASQVVDAEENATAALLLLSTAVSLQINNLPCVCGSIQSILDASQVVDAEGNAIAALSLVSTAVSLKINNVPCVCCSIQSIEQAWPHEKMKHTQDVLCDEPVLLCDNCGSSQNWSHTMEMFHSVVRSTSKDAQSKDHWLPKIRSLMECQSSTGILRIDYCIACSFKSTMSSHRKSTLDVPQGKSILADHQLLATSVADISLQSPDAQCKSDKTLQFQERKDELDHTRKLYQHMPQNGEVDCLSSLSQYFSMEPFRTIPYDRKKLSKHKLTCTIPSKSHNGIKSKK